MDFQDILNEAVEQSFVCNVQIFFEHFRQMIKKSDFVITVKGNTIFAKNEFGEYQVLDIDQRTPKPVGSATAATIKTTTGIEEEEGATAKTEEAEDSTDTAAIATETDAEEATAKTEEAEDSTDTAAITTETDAEEATPTPAEAEDSTDTAAITTETDAEEATPTPAEAEAEEATPTPTIERVVKRTRLPDSIASTSTSSSSSTRKKILRSTPFYFSVTFWARQEDKITPQKVQQRLHQHIDIFNSITNIRQNQPTNRYALTAVVLRDPSTNEPIPLIGSVTTINVNDAISTNFSILLQQNTFTTATQIQHAFNVYLFFQQVNSYITSNDISYDSALTTICDGQQMKEQFHKLFLTGSRYDELVSTAGGLWALTFLDIFTPMIKCSYRSLQSLPYFINVVDINNRIRSDENIRHLSFPQ